MARRGTNFWMMLELFLHLSQILLRKECGFRRMLNRGALIILYPKFHPEFNWIEMYWGECKRYSRKHWTYRFKDLIQILPDALRSPSLATVRRFAQKSFRYMDAYREKNGHFLHNKASRARCSQVSGSQNYSGIYYGGIAAPRRKKVLTVKKGARPSKTAYGLYVRELDSGKEIVGV